MTRGARLGKRQGCGQQGMTLLEFVLSALVMSLVIFVLLGRLASVLEGELDLLVDIEAVTVNHSVNAMQTALTLEVSRAHAQGEARHLPEWDGGNALELIQSRDWFRGAFVEGLPGPGTWSYDAARGHVVYDPRYLESGEEDGRWRWRVVHSNGGLQLQPVALAGLPGEAAE